MKTQESMISTVGALVGENGLAKHHESIIGRGWRAWRAAPLGVRLIVGLSLSASATALVWLVMYLLYLAVAMAPFS